MFTYLLRQWRLLSGHLAALERCVWALPVGHGEPPCPLASWARDVRPRVGLTPPGAGSPGDSTWLLTWPCPAVPAGNLVLPRAAHTWRTSTAFALLAAPPVFTSLQHPDCQDDRPKRYPGLQKRPPPGAPGSPGTGRLPSSLRTDTAQTQKEEEASGCPAQQLAGPRPSVSARTSLGRAFKGARALRPPMPHSGRGLPSPGAQQKVPTLVRGWRAPAGRGTT